MKKTILISAITTIVILAGYTFLAHKIHMKHKRGGCPHGIDSMLSSENGENMRIICEKFGDSIHIEKIIISGESEGCCGHGHGNGHGNGHGKGCCDSGNSTMSNMCHKAMLSGAHDLSPMKEDRKTFEGLLSAEEKALIAKMKESGAFKEMFESGKHEMKMEISDEDHDAVKKIIEKHAATIKGYMAKAHEKVEMTSSEGADEKMMKHMEKIIMVQFLLLDF